MKHTLSVLVEDESGALSRIAGLFARRGFNIDSLAVGPAEAVGRSRLTMVVEGDEHPSTDEQTARQACQRAAGSRPLPASCRGTGVDVDESLRAGGPAQRNP